MDPCVCCEFCEKKYRSNKAVKLHVKLKHPESYADKSIRQSFSRRNLYICSSCKHSFSNKVSLRTHIFNTHLTGLRQRKILCAFEKCKVHLNNYKNYDVHLLSDHGVETKEEKIIFGNRAGNFY